MAGEFLSNPLVGAIGSALGLDPLMAGAGGSNSSINTAPPIPAPVKVTSPKTTSTSTLRDERLQQSLSRDKGNRNTNSTSGRGSQPGRFGLPGMMSPEILNHPAVQQLLSQYGINHDQIQSTIQNANPNLFITDQAAYQKHPVLAGMTERALEGLAFTKGSNTWGEGLSNVAQGMLSANGARVEKYNNQLMAPFNQASQVAGLQNVAIELKLKEAQTRYDKSHSEYMDTMGDLRPQMLALQQQREADTHSHQQQMENLQKQNHNLMLMGKIQSTPFNKVEQSRYTQLVMNAGGDPLNVEPTDLQELLNTAAQRKIDEAHANQVHVANIGAGSRVAAASIGANGRGTVSDRSDLGESQRVEKGIEDEQKQFLKTLDSMRPATDAEGHMVTPGDTNAINHARSVYQARWNTAHQNTQHILDSIRGSVMHGPAKKPSDGGNHPAPVGYRDPASGKTKQKDGTWK
jgi:hypothetical protein